MGDSGAAPAPLSLPAMIEPDNPEHGLALGYLAADVRPRIATLLALDARLASIVARTTEPMIGLMRLVWWRDALAALADRPPPAEPLLLAAADLVAAGIPASALADLVEGWEALIDDPELGDDAVALHARVRGGGLFGIAGLLLGASEPDRARLARAGEGWARVDLARHASDLARAGAILATALPPLRQAMTGAWPRPLRPLAQFAALALDDARRGVGGWRVPASRGRLLRILRVQTFGR